MRKFAVTCLLAFVPAAVLAQKPAPPAPAQVAQEVRDYRMANEDRIMRELREFLAIPNIASDTPNIQKNAAHLVEMLEARGIEAHLLPITGLADQMAAIEQVLTPEQREQFKPAPIELRKGEASFHHPLMVHGSYANETPWPRRAVVINVFRDGVVSAADEPLLDGVPAIPAGQQIDGRFFPLLFAP